MAGKMKHKARSRKTANRRLMAARYYLNYHLTREQRQALQALMLEHFAKKRRRGMDSGRPA